MSNYSTYLAELSSGGINISAPAYPNAISYTSPVELTFTCGILNYTGGNSNLNNTWVFNCTNTPSAFPVFGFSNEPYFYGYIISSNSGNVYRPTWLWNNLPIGTYILFGHSDILGNMLVKFYVTYTGGTLHGNYQNYQTWVNPGSDCTLNNPTSTTPTMNISISCQNDNKLNPHLTVYLFKLI